MIPEPFEYRRASSVDEAIALLSTGGEAKLLAGGHSLLPLMKMRMSAPSLLVDIAGIRELSYVHEAGDHVAVGALTRHADLDRNEVLRREAPLLAHVAGQVGDPQVRHRGTIGGSIAHGDPASDLPAACLALDASFVVAGPQGERKIPASEFFRGFLETDLAADEVLIEIVFPRVAGAGWSFQKFNRRAQDWAIVGVAALANGSTRIGLVNMGSMPLRAAGTELALEQGASVAEAALHASDGLDPPSDLNATPEYRRHLAAVLVGRALEEAARNKA
ncbi:MAG: FAD binding domain-containing protein [Acidimicrobiales bacterium]|jgi:carbon-monoxide dehydrogenase medium subunit